MNTIGHWIGGQRSGRRVGSGRSSTRRAGCSRRGRAGVGRRGRRRGEGRGRRRRRVGCVVAEQARRRCCSAFRELIDAHRDELAADRHQRARQGARRRAGRGRPRPRVRRVRLRHPAAAEGLAQRRRCRPASTCTRSCSRSGVVAGITPFNFPVMVPLWMLANAIACGNAFVLEAVGEGPVGVAAPRRAGAARRASPTASSTSCRATPKRSTRC